MAKPSTDNQLWRAATAFVVKLRDANRAQVEDALIGAKQGANDFGLPATERQYYKTLASILSKELRQFGPKGRAVSPRRKNPATTKGKKTMAKKRRTAKQRAATKKMIAANRARLRKKTKTARRKTSRRKVRRKARRNPQKARPGLKVKKKSQLWVVFRCFGRDVQYATVKMGRGAHVGLTGMRSEAAIFKTKPQATNIANYLARKHTGRHMWGIVNEKQTGVQIRNFCEKALAGN